MRELYISERAQRDIRNVFVYLEENWPKSVKIDFQKELFRTIRILRRNPDIFPEMEDAGIYKAVVTKHNSILYSFNDSQVEILMIFDTRLHPQKRKK